MAQATVHDPVAFFVGIITADEKLWNAAAEKLTSQWGKIDFTSERLNFDQFTDYYSDEMGNGLLRFWAAFRPLGQPEELIRMKWSCTAVENSLAVGGKRRINIDPGYITEAKVVLASFKDFAHRIYLTEGVFADMQLVYRDGKFVPQNWTFADYKTDAAQRFFQKLREIYRHKLKSYIDGEYSAILHR